MVKMTFDKYDELMEKFEAMPNTIHDYGITMEDMERMKEKPDKYIQFAMYLSTRPWYMGKGNNAHVFINPDALNPADTACLLKKFINENLYLYDKNDSKEYDKDELEAMKALLQLA